VNANPSLVQVLSDWSFSPSVVVGVLLVVTIYLLGLRELSNRGRLRRTVRPRNEVYFALGMLAVMVALMSPIDALSNQLFAVHMVQHFLLLMVAPPLLLLGKPIPVLVVGAPRSLTRWVARRHARVAWFRGLTRLLTSPFVAWPLFVGTMLAWHFPVFFDAALQNDSMHVLEHLCFLTTGILFWWVVIQPYPGKPHLAYGWRFLYVLLAMVPESALGFWIILAGSPIYSFYTPLPRLWAISVLDDQALAGNIMMIGGDAVLAITLIWLGVGMMARLEEIEIARFAESN
jgi:putative membrane protein